MLSVPSIFDLLDLNGLFIERGTDGIAASWNTKSIFLTDFLAMSKLLISPSISSKFGLSKNSAIFSFLPVEKLSTTRTNFPSSKKYLPVR